MPAPSPLSLSGAIVSFEIKIDGQPIPSTYQVIAVTTIAVADGSASAKIVLTDGNVADAAFPISESENFAPGKGVQILARYAGTNALIFSGEIASQTIDIRPSRPASTLTVNCSGSIPGAASSTQPVLTLTYGLDIFELNDTTGIASSSASIETSGTIKFQGSSVPTVGCAIELQGLGTRFNGIVPVRGVEHEIAEGDWLTTVHFGPAPAPAAPQALIRMTTMDGRSITLDDAAGTITLADPDRNVVTLSSSGISISSSSNLTLTAAENITVHAGLNLAMTANMSASVKSEASAELSTGGQLVIRGALVMIN